MTTITPESKRTTSGITPRAPHTMRPLGAVALLLGLAWGQAHALSLGRLSVQSALGEPLRAEIAVPDITPDEAASLKATLASPEAFKAAGVEYNSSLANIRVVFEQRNNGRAALVLTSTRPFTEPFLDLILEANWANGKISRDYTLLLDPPSLTAPAPVTEAVVPAPAGAAPQTSTRPSAAKPPVQPRPARVPSATPKATAPVPVTAPSTEGDGATQQVVVKPGDTAGRIAAATKPVGISLDQMLLALLGSNPQAFLERNVNRLRAGAVLNVPTAEQAAATPPEQASQAIVAQSRDFNAFRAKLAANVAATPEAKPTRQAAGKVEARVEDKQATAAIPDKLQLSKGSVTAGGKASPEETLAQARENQAAATRAAELSKNLDDLTKLTGKAPAGASPATGAASSASAPVPGVPIAMGNSAASAATPAAPASSPSSTPVAAASGPATAASAKAAPTPAQAPVAPEAEGFFEGSGFLLGLGALLALLLGLALFRARQRKNDNRPSAFMDSLVQADPMYGSSGGQRVDTREKDSGNSTMGFSPSQLDAASDVDPVVEAEVYLAYGRDVQAEEILKEALRTHPTRVSIHVKLAEIYAKRRDSKAFETSVAQVAALTQSTGPDWAHVQTLSQQLDPSTVLLQTAAPAPEVATVADTPAPTEPPATPVPAPSPTMAAPENLPPLDLDMDFSPGADLHTPVATAAPAPMFTAPDAAPAALDMLDFKLDQLDMAPSTDSATATPGVSSERLEVKLELASEFMAIGDDEGARALVQEVLAEATGDLKARAQKLLTSLR
ncbi:MAG: FimV/HubP family polar landmark protein [Pseudomonadota bacterium]